MTKPSDAHYKIVVNAITEGELVPFLGAGASLYGRPDNTAWQRGKYLPRSDEVARHLANKYGCAPDQDLMRVAQYVAIMAGSRPLYKELRWIFSPEYPPTELHRFLAMLPSIIRGKGYGAPFPLPLIVTTNYDDLLERAFDDAKEPFDLVTYEAEGIHRGKFWHRKPNGEIVLIEHPKHYDELGIDKSTLRKRTMILKIHGAVNRAYENQDSFVITEDHYIEYLTRTDISTLMPVTLEAKLRNSHLLFMGYSLRDWNLRVILHRIWGEQKLTYTSWAILWQPQELDERFWHKRGVEFFDMQLEEYLAEFKQRVQALPPKGGEA